MFIYSNLLNLYANSMQMIKTSVSIVLDKRRIKANGLYPAKLRVFTSTPRKQKLYPINFDFSEKDFASIWETSKPRAEHKENRKKLQAIEVKANRDIGGLKRFTFEAFESVFYGAMEPTHSDTFSLFDVVIKEKLALGSISTAEKYDLAKKCLQAFRRHKNEGADQLHIEEISIEFLKEYDHYCEKVKNLSVATRGIYLRNLRTIYNLAIKKGYVSNQGYPFGRDGFSISTSSKVNKALSQEELKTLWHTKPSTPQQEMAKDFWFFSYYSYGLNTKDLCELTHSSVRSDEFDYVRAKTKKTKKEVTRKKVALNVPLKQIIERRKVSDSNYLFGLISDNDSAIERHKKIKMTNSFINKHFRKFAISAGIRPELASKLGTYHARHSFATIAIKSGKSMALVSEILHDGNLAMTAAYLKSFSSEEYQNLSDDMVL